MTTNVPVANQDELNIFLKAAEDRYAEMGVPPHIAKPLFDQEVGNVSEHLFGKGAQLGPPVLPALPTGAPSPIAQGPKPMAPKPAPAAGPQAGPAGAPAAPSSPGQSPGQKVTKTTVTEPVQAKAAEASDIVYGAAMDRMFELGIPKKQAENLIADFTMKQARAEAVQEGTNHIFGKIAGDYQNHSPAYGYGMEPKSTKAKPAKAAKGAKDAKEAQDKMATARANPAAVAFANRIRPVLAN